MTSLAKALERVNLDLIHAGQVNSGNGAVICKSEDLRTLIAAAQDAERYRFLRDGEYSEALLLMLRAAGVHQKTVDAAVDAALEAKPEGE